MQGFPTKPPLIFALRARLSAALQISFSGVGGPPNAPRKRRLRKLGGQVPCMPPRAIRIVIDTERGKREVLSIIEKSSGELIIPLKFGGTFEVDKILRPIHDYRYSIHLSPRSPNFTTVKLTTRLDDRKITSVALTDSVKRKSGFSNVYVRRCQYPISQVRDKKYAASDTVVTLPAFDPYEMTLFQGVFLGHPDSEFTASHPDIGIYPIQFRMFQLVIFFSFRFFFPTATFGEIIHSATLPPEAEDHPIAQDILRELMKGRTPDKCLASYENHVDFLSKRFLMRILPTITDERLKRSLNSTLSSLSEINLDQSTASTEPQLMRLLIPRKSPNPRQS